MPRYSMPRLAATLVLTFGVASAPAIAHERPVNPVRDYATVLRVMNPHLPDWQRRKYAASILANAQRTRVDPRLIMAIVTVESSWRSNAVSRVGARGLGQLMPSTAAGLQVNARDASENLRGTANYLKSLLDRFRGQDSWFEKAIAGYNAGPNAVKKYDGIPPYAETQRYVVKVLSVYRQLYSSVAIAWTPYVSHRRDATRRIVTAEPSALSDAALSAAVPQLALDAFVFAPIPAFKSSY